MASVRFSFLIEAMADENDDLMRITRIETRLKYLSVAVYNLPLDKLKKPKSTIPRRKRPARFASTCVSALVLGTYAPQRRDLAIFIDSDLRALSQEIDLIIDDVARLRLSSKYQKLKDCVKDDADMQALEFKSK